MASDLAKAVAVVNDRSRAIVDAQQGGLKLSVRRFGALLLSGHDLNPREVEDLAVAEIAMMLDAGGIAIDDERDLPLELLAQLWMRGVATGARLRVERAAPAPTTTADPMLGQVWEEIAKPRVPGMQPRRLRISAKGWEATTAGDGASREYIIGRVVRGEGAIRHHRVQLDLPALHRDWRLVAGPGALAS